MADQEKVIPVRMLFISSANEVRSPTAEHVARLMGHRADSCGSEPTAVRKVSIERCQWADCIVCFSNEAVSSLNQFALHLAGKKIYVWEVPNIYRMYCHPELIRECDLRIKATLEAFRAVPLVRAVEIGALLSAAPNGSAGATAGATMFPPAVAPAQTNEAPEQNTSGNSDRVTPEKGWVSKVTSDAGSDAPTTGTDIVPPPSGTAIAPASRGAAARPNDQSPVQRFVAVETNQFKHGTATMYVSRGCRCEECTEANRCRNYAYRYARDHDVSLEEAAKAPVPPRTKGAPEHGRGTTLYQRGCRCQACKKAHAAICKASKDRRKAAAAISQIVPAQPDAAPVNDVPWDDDPPPLEGTTSAPSAPATITETETVDAEPDPAGASNGPVIPHGTSLGYEKHLCRCGDCLEWFADYTDSLFGVTSSRESLKKSLQMA